MQNKLNEAQLKRHRMLLEYSINQGQAPSDDSYYQSGKRVQLKEEEEEPPAEETAQGYTKKGGEAVAPAPDAAPTPEQPQSPADAMIPNMDGVEKPEGEEIDMTGDPKDDLNSQGKPDGESDPNESREDILSQLIQLHADKLKELEEFAVSMNERSRGYEAMLQTMPEVQAKVGQLENQVEELTPPTPLQAMDKIVKLSGGETPQDWWNKYWAEKKQNQFMPQNPYYPTQKGDMKEPPNQAQVGKDGNVSYYLKPSDLPDLTQDQAMDSFKPKQAQA